MTSRALVFLFLRKEEKKRQEKEEGLL